MTLDAIRAILNEMRSVRLHSTDAFWFQETDRLGEVLHRATPGPQEGSGWYGMANLFPGETLRVGWYPTEAAPARQEVALTYEQVAHADPVVPLDAEDWQRHLHLEWCQEGEQEARVSHE